MGFLKYLESLFYCKLFCSHVVICDIPVTFLSMRTARSKQLRDFSMVGHLLCIMQPRNYQTQSRYTGL